MSAGDAVAYDRMVEEDAAGDARVDRRAAGPVSPLPPGGPAPAGVAVGELLGLKNDGRTPLVAYPGQPGHAAVAARTVVDLHGGHIGMKLVLMFESADPGKPIIMGVLHVDGDWPLAQTPGEVDIDADGERLVVTAREQLVLRCGTASITLTKAGKVLIRGTYISSTSSGVNRVNGGAVQLN